MSVYMYRYIAISGRNERHRSNQGVDAGGAIGCNCAAPLPEGCPLRARQTLAVREINSLGINQEFDRVRSMQLVHASQAIDCQPHRYRVTHNFKIHPDHPPISLIFLALAGPPEPLSIARSPTSKTTPFSLSLFLGLSQITF